MGEDLEVQCDLIFRKLPHSSHECKLNLLRVGENIFFGFQSSPNLGAATILVQVVEFPDAKFGDNVGFYGMLKYISSAFAVIVVDVDPFTLILEIIAQNLKEQPFRLFSMLISPLICRSSYSLMSAVSVRRSLHR